MREALAAAGLLASKGLKMAIEEANYSVSNKVTDDSQSFVQPEKVDVLPLPFYL